MSLLANILLWNRTACTGWAILLVIFTLILAYAHVDETTADPVVDLAPSIFRNWTNGNRGARVLGHFKPISGKEEPPDKIKHEQCQSFDDATSCPFFWCDVLNHYWEDNNRTDCDCYAREQECGDPNTVEVPGNTTFTQRVFGWRTDEGRPVEEGYQAGTGFHRPPAGLSDPVREVLMGARSSGQELRWEWSQNRLDILPENESLAPSVMRNLPPMILQEWESGEVRVELGIELSTSVPRIASGACERKEVCFCGAHRCMGADFQKYESQRCEFTGNLLEDEFTASSGVQCMDRCRELGCTGFMRYIKGVDEGTCQFYDGDLIPTTLASFNSGYGDCFVRKGDKIRLVDNYVEFGNYAYASIDNVKVDAPYGDDHGWSVFPHGDTCQHHWNKHTLPQGWELVPDVIDEQGANLTNFIRKHTWSTYGMVLDNGKCYATAESRDDLCKSSADLLKKGAGKYWVGMCSTRVMIRRAFAPTWVGCYRDDGDRDFADGPRRHGFFVQDEIIGDRWVAYTTATCRTTCAGYKFFALQQGGWCQCGDTYGSDVKYERMADWECGAECVGEEGLTPKRYCGGTLRNAVYKVQDDLKSDGPTWTRKCVNCASEKQMDYYGDYAEITDKRSDSRKNQMAFCKFRCEQDVERNQVDGELSKCRTRCTMQVQSGEEFAPKTLKECKELCKRDQFCKAIDYGKNRKANNCFLNRVGNGEGYTQDENFDVYVIHREPWLTTATDLLIERNAAALGPSPHNRRAIVNVVFGMEVDKETLSNNWPGPSATVWKFAENFDIKQPWIQTQVDYFCTMTGFPDWFMNYPPPEQYVIKEKFAEYMKSQPPPIETLQANYHNCKAQHLRVTQRFCWMSDFRRWLMSKDIPFPVPANEFDALAQEFTATEMLYGDMVGEISHDEKNEKRNAKGMNVTYASEKASDFVWVRGGAMKAFYASFELSVDRNASEDTETYYYSTGDGLERLQTQWDDFLTCWNGKLGDSYTPAWHTSSMWAMHGVELGISSTTFGAVGLMLVAVFICALSSTWSVCLALCVSSSVFFVVCGVAFVLFALLGRGIGPSEAIVVLVSAAGAGVPSLHMAQLYAFQKPSEGDASEDPEWPPMFKRTRLAVISVGHTITYQSAAVVCGAAFFLGSKTALAQDMGGALVLTALLAGFAALAVLPAALIESIQGCLNCGKIVRACCGCFAPCFRCCRRGKANGATDKGAPSPSEGDPLVPDQIGKPDTVVP